MSNAKKISQIKTYSFNTLAIGFSVILALIGFRVQSLAPLAFIWMLPVICVMPRWTPKQALCFGWLWFFFVGGLSCLWLYQAAVGYLDTSPYLLAIIYVLLWFWLAIPFAAFAYIYAKLQLSQSAYEPWLAAALFTVIWVYFPSPFPGLPLHGLSQLPKFIAILDLSGVSGLIFVSTLYCFSVRRAINKKSKNDRVLYGLLVLIIPIVMLAYGQLRQHQIEQDKRNTSAEQWLKIGYVQPNLRIHQPIHNLYQLTEKLIKQESPELIVWPELTTSYSLIDSYFNRRDTFNLVNEHKQDLLVASSFVYSDTKLEGDRFKYYSQLQLVEKGEITAKYNKQKLVPFFEYIPEWLSFLKAYINDYQLYIAGDNQSPMPYKSFISIATVICYEIIFPDLVWDMVKQGANILINPTSDRRFDGTQGSHYHLQTASFQNISHRIPWVRATNTGISLIKGADGKIISPATENMTTAIAAANVFIPTKKSIYTQYGDWWAKLLLIALAVYLLARIQQRNK